MENDLNFKGNDPGAVKYGNFINYYKFHPIEERISYFSEEIWKKTNGFNDEPMFCLDVGCNSGVCTTIRIIYIIFKPLSYRI